MVEILERPRTSQEIVEQRLREEIAKIPGLTQTHFDVLKISRNFYPDAGELDVLKRLNRPEYVKSKRLPVNFLSGGGAVWHAELNLEGSLDFFGHLGSQGRGYEADTYIDSLISISAPPYTNWEMLERHAMGFLEDLKEKDLKLKEDVDPNGREPSPEAMLQNFSPNHWLYNFFVGLGINLKLSKLSKKCHRVIEP